MNSQEEKKGRLRREGGGARLSDADEPEGSAVPYQAVFETAPDGMLLINATTGRIVEVNPALCSLSGFGSDELRGRKFWDIFPLRATDAGLVVFRELRTQKRIYYDDLPFETKDRGRITVELICTIHDTKMAKIIQCTVRDVSKYQQMKQDIRNAEDRFKALFQEAGIGIALLDQQGRFLDGNTLLCAMLGYEANDLRTITFADILPRENRKTSKPFFQGVLAGETESTHAAIQCARRDGTAFWTLMTVTAVRRARGTQPYFILTLQDITDRKHAEEAVIKSRNFFRSLINELPNPIRISDTDAKCDYVNKTWIEFTNRRFEQEIGDRWLEGIHPEDRNRVREIFSLSFRNRSPYMTEYRLAHASDTYHWVVEFGRPFRDIDGNFAGVISSCYDVHDRKVFEERLHSISFTDDLTGLLNRRGFFTFAQQQVKLANRSRKGFLFLFADLDGLKKINDTLGHQEGDLALTETAHVLQEVFRESDIIARLGGDEFAVLMTENAGTGGKRVIMQRLRESIAEHNARTDRRYVLSISAGIIRYDPANPCTLDVLLSRADRLMYREKKSKRGR